MHLSKIVKAHDENNKQLRIVGNIKLCAHTERPKQLETVVVCHPLAVPSKLGCDFGDPFVECIYQKTGSEELTDEPTVFNF